MPSEAPRCDSCGHPSDRHFATGYDPNKRGACNVGGTRLTRSRATAKRTADRGKYDEACDRAATGDPVAGRASRRRHPLHRLHGVLEPTSGRYESRRNWTDRLRKVLPIRFVPAARGERAARSGLHPHRRLRQLLDRTSPMFSRRFTWRSQRRWRRRRSKSPAVFNRKQEDWLADLAEERVDSLVRGGFNSIIEEVGKSLGVRLAPDDRAMAAVADAVEVRNVLVHNRGVVDRRAASKLKLDASDIGGTLDI